MPEGSIYRSAQGQAEVIALYEKHLANLFRATKKLRLRLAARYARWGR